MRLDFGDPTRRPRIAAVLGALTLVLVAFLGIRLEVGAQNPNVPVPIPTMPNPNGYVVFLQADAALRDRPLVDEVSMPPAFRRTHSFAPEQMAHLVAENEPAFLILRRGLSLPYQAPPFRSTALQTWGHLPDYRRLASGLVLRGDLRKARGDWDGAMESYLDAVSLGAISPRGSGVSGQRIGVQCQQLGRRGAWQVVDHLSASEMRAAEDRLDRLERNRVSWAQSLEEEKWARVATLQEMFRRPDGLDSLFPDSENGKADSRDKLSRRLMLLLIGKRTILDRFMHYMDVTIANARLPDTADPPDPMLPSDAVSRVLCMVQYAGRFEEAQSVVLQNALLKTVLALRLFRLERGAYPARLEDLVPRYLGAVPADPFAVKCPLRYARKGGSYLLYSIGPDGNDDGGIPVANPHGRRRSSWMPNLSPESKGDIVAGVNTQ